MDLLINQILDLDIDEDGLVVDPDKLNLILNNNNEELKINLINFLNFMDLNKNLININI